MWNNKCLHLLWWTLLLAGCWMLVACAHKSGRRHAAARSTDRVEAPTSSRHQEHTVVHMRQENGVYYVPIVVNGLNLDFIFDTGASDISISAAEASVMMRQGKIQPSDIIGTEKFQDATGGITEGAVINLRTVQIGDIVLENVRAAVANNMKAPLLLGQSALAKFGKVTIDYQNSTIEFN